MKHTTEPRVFFYFGDPSQGTWFDLEVYDDWDSIREELSRELNIQISDLENAEILAADSEGVAGVFHGKHGTFDLAAYNEWEAKLPDDMPAEAVKAYGQHFGEDLSNGPGHFLGAYLGEYESREAFSQEWIDSIHDDVIKNAEQAGLAIDWAATANNLSDDFVFVEKGGSVFVFYNV